MPNRTENYQRLEPLFSLPQVYAFLYHQRLSGRSALHHHKVRVKFLQEYQRMALIYEQLSVGSTSVMRAFS